MISLDYVITRLRFGCGILNPVSLGQNVKRLRVAAGIPTQRALADRLHVPQPQVSDWENDRYAILETLTLIKLAKVLRCSIDDLLEGVDPDYDVVRRARAAARRSAPPPRHAARGRGQVRESAATGDEQEHVAFGTDASDTLPVVAEGAAAPAGVAWTRGEPPPGGIEERIPRPRDVTHKDAYAVRVLGDAMAPAYPPHTLAIVAPDRRLEDGDEAYVQLRADERLIRLVRKTRGGYLLESYNHRYPARVVTRKDVLALHVILYSRRRDF